jgi:hypothetical protein
VGTARVHQNTPACAPTAPIDENNKRPCIAVACLLKIMQLLGSPHLSILEAHNQLCPETLNTPRATISLS